MKFIESYEQYSEVCEAMGEIPTEESFQQLQDDIQELRGLIEPKNLTDFINSQLLLGVQFTNDLEAKKAFLSST